MPKDATKNIDRYKIRGGELNEFDFHQNQEEYAEAEQQKSQVTNLIPGTPPEARMPRETTKTKTTKATSKATKSTKKKPTPARGASAKKLAARKAAKKK